MTKAILLTITVSAIVHAGFVHFLASRKAIPKTRNLANTDTINLEVRETSRKPEPQVPKKVVTETELAQKAATVPAVPTPQPAQEKRKKMQVQDFLPGLKSIRPSLTPGNSAGIAAKVKALSGKKQETLSLLRSKIAVQIELPLNLVDSLPDGSATFLLQNFPEDPIYSIFGSPYLRAILHREFSKPENKKEIFRILRLLQLSSIKILFQLSSKVSIRQQNPDGMTYSQKNRFYGEGILIESTKYTGGFLAPGASGFVLSDDLAEKRRKWERKEVLELEQSPAYGKRIRRQPY